MFFTIAKILKCEGNTRPGDDRIIQKQKQIKYLKNK